MILQSEQDILQAQQQTKESFYKQCVAAIEKGDKEGLQQALRSAASAGYPASEIEYSASEEYGLFYHLVRKLQEMTDNMFDPKSDIFRPEEVQAVFRGLTKVLYEAGIRPDVKATSTLAALCFGEVDPNIAVLNKNAPYGKIFDPAIMAESFRGKEDWNSTESDTRNGGNYRGYVGCTDKDHLNAAMYLTSNDTMIYPFYMPYMKFTPSQRFIFDELVWLSSYFGSKGIEPVQSPDIVRQVKDDYAKLDDSDIDEAKQLDIMNIILERVFDFCLIVRTTNTNGKSRDEALNDSIGWVNYFNTFREREFGNCDWARLKKINPKAYDNMLDFPKESLDRGIVIYSRYNHPERFARQYYKDLRSTTVEAMLRLGFALTHPGTLSRYDSLKFADTPENAKENEALRKELEYYTKIYIDYKKQFFREDGQLISPKEMAILPLPIYSENIFDADANWDLPKPQTTSYETLTQNTTEYTTFDNLPHNFAWVKLCNTSNYTDASFVCSYNDNNNLQPFGTEPNFDPETNEILLQKTWNQSCDQKYWYFLDRLSNEKDEEVVAVLENALKNGWPADHHPKSTNLTLLEALMRPNGITCSKKYECIDKLLDAGADASRNDAEDNTLLHLAISNGYSYYYVKKLIDNSKDVNAVNKNGETAFGMAAREFRNVQSKTYKQDTARKIYTLLLEKGADPYLDNRWQETDYEYVMFERLLSSFSYDDMIYNRNKKSQEEIERDALTNVLELKKKGTYDRHEKEDLNEIEKVKKDCLQYRSDLPFKEHVSEVSQKYPEQFYQKRMWLGRYI